MIMGKKKGGGGSKALSRIDNRGRDIGRPNCLSFLY